MSLESNDITHRIEQAFVITLGRACCFRKQAVGKPFHANYH